VQQIQAFQQQMGQLNFSTVPALSLVGLAFLKCGIAMFPRAV
jgi:hypothetical protein